MEGRDKESKHKHRLKGLFSKDKKASTSEAEGVDDFLRGSSDKLNWPAPTPASPSQPPRLARIDTATARRWPTAAEIHNSKLARGRSASPKRNRKGLVVRFTDDRPEIIGEGGDEAELPTVSLSLRNRAYSHPPREQRSTDHQNTQTGRENDPSRYAGNSMQFGPGLLRRTQTGFESIPETNDGTHNEKAATVKSPESGELAHSHDPKSFAARVKADMRAGEGKALLQAATLKVDQRPSRTTSPTAGGVESTSHLEEAQKNTVNNVPIPPSLALPAALIPGRPSTPQARQASHSGLGGSMGSNFRSPTSITSNESPPPVPSGSASTAVVDSPERLSRSSTMTGQGATIAPGIDSIREFSFRVAHLFTLFRLSTESVRPLSKCSIEELVRVALWWFLYGRLHLEAWIRDRPSLAEGQQASFFARQQAYADLAKSLWIIETALPQYHDFPNDQTLTDPKLSDLMNVRQGILSNLTKLTSSMKRNNFLPPEEAPLPQGLDSSIWVEEEGNQSLVATQRQASSMSISSSMPLGDSGLFFQYCRLFARGTLMEDGDAQCFHFSILATLVRNIKETTMSLVIANQAGSLKLCIQADKNRGPTWENVEWHAESNMLNIRLPRGFTIELRCSKHDFRTFWSIYDYQKKVYTDFKQKRDEVIVFESVLKSFQYFDQSGNSTFPKDPIPQCRLRIFERVVIETAATGNRNLHQGFRVGLITSPAIKSLRGVTQDLPPDLPIQFGFLRGEGGLPAFLLKIDNGRSKYTMVFTFEDAKERSLLHTRLTGTSLRAGEVVVAETQMKSFSVTTLQAEGKELSCLKGLEWQSARVIDEDQEDQQNSNNALSEHLRVIMDFKVGSLTDRFNVGPGELKIRLGVTSLNELKIVRNKQQDMTLSIIESQVSKELPNELAELLRTIAEAQSTRVYTFPSLKDLHLFQAALTGFLVVFDGMASSFNISRRRMVVPIYKKWDAVTTRVQVVQREKVVQLVAFFENFSHGDCMNITLKSTDTFESSGKSGKFSLRIVDAKFALGKDAGEGETALDKGFVCLDLPEYPGEHDDITIVFDNEPGRYPSSPLKQSEIPLTLPDRENFMKALPAPVKAASRMPSVRR
jgi:hypothetical protein